MPVGRPTLNCASLSDANRDLQAFEALWGAFARTGIVEAPSAEYASEHFHDLDEEEQGRLRRLIRDTPGFGANFAAETSAAMARVGIVPSAANLPLGSKLVMLARMSGAWACRNGVEVTSAPDNALPTPATAPAVVNGDGGPAKAREAHIPRELRDLTPTEVAERMIAETPKMFEHRNGGKRASEQTGEQTLRQIRWAASLLKRSTPAGQPLWKLSTADLKDLDSWFDRLPISFGKSPGDRRDDVTLVLAHERALARVEEGEIEADEIGLTIPTCNEHYRKIAQVHAFLVQAVPGIPALDFGKFIQPDRKDERAARLRYTVPQGRAIFSLPPWTGCAGEHDRLTAGDIVIHDSLFYVLLLVWYTGARREEICKLRLVDLDVVNDIYFLRIASTETGRVKNMTAVRCIPLADELIRLGFIHYVDALKAAGETLLFPEIDPADGTKRKRGDVFYKLWWIISSR